MKRFILLLFIMSIPAFAQFSTITDSLKSGVDTVAIYDLSGQSYISVVGVDTGSVKTDSIKVYLGGIRKNYNGNIDTLWTQAGLKDSTGTIIFTIAKAGGNSRFEINSNVTELVKLVLTNAEFLTGRVWKFILSSVNRR